MPDSDLSVRIERRLARAGLALPDPARDGLVVYLELLGKWNKRINLTAYSLDDPSDEAIDRLIVEAVSMARFVIPGDAIAIDVGSGGGSPALPFRLAAPSLRLVMVESKMRKAAFLREAVRLLAMTRTTVENCRLEELASGDALAGQADIVTMRAVRADEDVVKAVRTLLKPRGRLFCLTSEKAAEMVLPGFGPGLVSAIFPESLSRIVVLERL